MTAFAAARRTTHGTATQTVAALVRKGYLARHRLPEDKRTVRLDVTAEGRAQLRDDPLNLIVDAIDRIADDERRLLAESLLTLHRILQKRDASR